MPGWRQNGVFSDKFSRESDFWLIFILWLRCLDLTQYSPCMFFVLKNCWNCGRKASETCSGCNLARYCGSFCQHKDWEGHHRVCGQQMSKTGDDLKKGPPSTCAQGKEPGKVVSSPGITRSKISSPTNSGDPITSLSDYVRKTPST